MMMRKRPPGSGDQQDTVRDVDRLPRRKPTVTDQEERTREEVIREALSAGFSCADPLHRAQYPPKMHEAACAALETLRARIEHLEAALREAMELHRIAVVYVLAATPRTERTDYIDRLGALEARALTTSTEAYLREDA